jgi:hypothetical protein
MELYSELSRAESPDISRRSTGRRRNTNKDRATVERLSLMMIRKIFVGIV